MLRFVLGERLFFNRRRLRPRRNALVFFQAFFGQLDGFFQLRIAAVPPEPGVPFPRYGRGIISLPIPCSPQENRLPAFAPIFRHFI